MRFQFVFAALAISYASALPIDERSILDKTEIITTTKRINAPVADVIATLHDFDRMIRLNPLVTSSTVDPTNPNVFTVVDKLPLFLGITIPTTYVATFESLPNGMNTDNTASAGVKLHNEWRAVEVDGATDLTETDTVTANLLLMPIVKSQLQTAHDELFETLASQLEAAAGTA
ncbi:hypothetical protein C8J57DRAFT_2991 [Mycena rebaudengoi]|nr:hypothetical protein C8J57DRAFT_2991 [Mycena rebaudengoi]